MKFYDTNALLVLGSKVLKEHFYISSTSLQELEHIKVSKNKDDKTKYESRKVLHILDDNPDSYDVIFVDNKVLSIINVLGLENTPDNQICACASMIKDIEFVTNDIACKMIAKNIFKLNVSSVKTNNDEIYKGYIEKSLSDEEMAYFYEHLNENIYGLLTNQYLVIKDKTDKVVDVMAWKNSEHENIKIPTIKSSYFGSIKPYNGDIYQQMVINSLYQNQITMIKGSAGTGKSYLAIGYLLWLLEKRKIEKIIVFCNTVATANSAKLGYYPGTKNEKLLDSQIGNMLGSKLGGTFGLEQMVQQEKIVLLPMSDVRGYDTTGMNAGIYITEAQNMDISLKIGRAHV